MNAIFFDLGGVIFSDLFSGGEIGFAKTLGIDPDELVKTYLSTDTPAYAKGHETDESRWQALADKLGVQGKSLDFWLNEYRNTYQLYPEMKPYLSQLAQRKDLKIGALSDQPHVAIDHLTSTYPEVFQLFNPGLIVISARIGLSKKDEDLAIYKLAIQKSGLGPGQTLFVDNSHHNVENASKAGMKAFYFDITNVPLAEIITKLDVFISNWVV